MSNSIYSIGDWTAGNANYNLNDIVSYQGNFYYCTTPHTSNVLLSFPTQNWSTTALVNGIGKPVFIWKGNYASDVPNEPRINSIKLGDGYEQRSPDGINNMLLTLNLNFEGKDLDETTAILHFLTQREGCESFVFYPPPPFYAQKLFVCKNWVPTFNFYNNFSIKVKFEEVPV